MSIGRILRERGFDATVGQTLVEGCGDPLRAECIALKRTGKPVKATLAPIQFCGIPCVLGLAGGVRRTLPATTRVVLGGTFSPNLIGLAAIPEFREGRFARFRDELRAHLTQLGVDPRYGEILEKLRSGGGVELSRDEIVRMRIVTTR